MAQYPYLIVGGGMSAAAAVNGIREIDQQAEIGLISRESHPPYDRPPLSKGLWKGKPMEKIWRKIDRPGVVLHLGRKIVSLNLVNKQAVDDQGVSYTYDKLLLATGGSPRRLPIGVEGIVYFRTLEDYTLLRAQTGENRRFGVIGGGFIGSEIAAALTMNGQQVTMVFPEEGIGANIFPPELSVFLKDYYRQKGVQVLSGETIQEIERQDHGYTLKTRHGRKIEVDYVIAGIGIRPETELAVSAGLKVDNGIVVDEYLRTSQFDIFAAGDVANFYNPAVGARMRVEHEDNALTMGRIAGKNMAGSLQPYHHLPYFYSDLFDLGYEAVGELNPTLEVFSDWLEPYQKGVIYYLKEGRVRGVLLWNVWGQVETARTVIAESGPHRPSDLRGRLQR